jgi:hypothetical protein
MELATSGFFTGMIGDIILQIITHWRGNFAGLRDYFFHHGILESIFIAGGILFTGGWIYQMLGLPLSYVHIFIYGCLLDIIYRNFHLMPSLDPTYHEALPPWLSMIWGGISMVLVLGMNRLQDFQF